MIHPIYYVINLVFVTPKQDSQNVTYSQEKTRYVLYNVVICTFTINVLKFLTLLFLFSNKILVLRAGIHKMFVRNVNREDPDLKKQFDVCPFCLGLFGRQLTIARNFRIFIICMF